MEKLEKFFREKGVSLISFPHHCIKSKSFCERVSVYQYMCVVLDVRWDHDTWYVKVNDGNQSWLVVANPAWEEELLRFCKGVYQFYEHLTPSDIRWDDYLHDLKADLRNNRRWAQGSFTAEEIQGFEQNITEIEAEIDAIDRKDYDSILAKYREKEALEEMFEYYLV